MIEISIALAVTMLSIASYQDIRERSVNDWVWAVFGSLGSLLIILKGFPDIITIVSIITSTCVALMARYMKLFGSADALAVIALAVIIPVSNGVLVPLIVLLGASVLSFLFTCLYNAFLNFSCLLNKEEQLFSEFDEPLLRKVIAFFLVHKKRRSERFVFSAESHQSGKMKFKFISASEDEFASQPMYVTTGIPLTLFMLVALILIVLLPSSWTDLFAL